MVVGSEDRPFLSSCPMHMENKMHDVTEDSGINPRVLERPEFPQSEDQDAELD
jgi:hypothetical protein